MSLDLWLASSICPTCQHQERTDLLNYTYNVAPMWYEIYPNQKQMINVDGLTGKESLPLLEYALQMLNRTPAKFIAMNPENGWGSYETFKVYIKNLIVFAISHPTWIWEACR